MTDQELLDAFDADAKARGYKFGHTYEIDRNGVVRVYSEDEEFRHRVRLLRETPRSEWFDGVVPLLRVL